MTEVLMTCTQCDDEIAVEIESAILRIDFEPQVQGELLFCCPVCGGPGVRHIVGELLTLLLLVGVEPLWLSEPTLPPDDRKPALPVLTPDDVLTWHEQLADVWFVNPWEH